MCCTFCLQAEGGKKAEAVATVVAAVDLARVRQPAHAEGGGAEEEAVEEEVQLQAAAEKHIEMKTLAAEPAAAVVSEPQRLQVTQVGEFSKFIVR